MSETIKYLKLNKTDKNGKVLDLAALADAGEFNIVHNNGNSSKFTLNNIGDKGDFILLEVTTTTQATEKVITDNNIDFYNSFSADIFGTQNVDYRFTPLIFNTPSSNPVSQDSFTLEGVDHPIKGILNDVGIYNFGKQPNASLRFHISGTITSSVTDDYQFVMIPRRSYINFASTLNDWNYGEFDFGNTNLSTFNAASQFVDLACVPFSGSIPITSSMISAIDATPLKISTTGTVISMSCDIRADICNSGSGWIVGVRKINASGSTTNDVTLTFTSSLTLDVSPFSIDYTSSSTPLSSSSPTAPGILIENTFTEKFQNSDFEVTLNNYNDNRKNSYIEEIDYSTDAKTPVNLVAIKARTATKAQVPDSNYTQHRVINPRYKGSRVSSADYNNFTRPVEQVANAGGYSFLNGDTGSYGGDESYGRTATIDKNPIYFAHFKDSVENRELFDTYTFKIDALIESPRGDIQGLAIEPNIIKIDGSNKNIESVASTFEKERKTIVNYGQLTKDGVDYTTLAVGDSKIFQGALEYNTIFSNTIDEINFFQTQSFFLNVNWCGVFQAPKDDELLLTGSNEFILRGSATGTACGYTSSIGTDSHFTSINTSSVAIAGPQLGLYHSMNHWVSQSIYLTGSVTTSSLGLPTGTKVNPSNQFNYLRLNFTSSGVDQYQDFNPFFIIKKGDEIRTIYNSISGSDPGVFVSQDFTVESVTTSSNPMTDGYLALALGPGGNAVLAHNTPIYNKIKVTPDPSTIGIPDGKIFSMTIRRRIEADDRVIVFQDPPSGSKGALTPTGDGFLIPNDFTDTQKRNVQTLINQLKGKNVFE